MENKPDLSKLSAVPYTLMIPLVGRARGRELFKDAVEDLSAERVLRELGTRGDEFMHPGTVSAVQDRTRIFKSHASDFFAKNPHATGANIGCGLSDYFQWLDCGTNHFIDADLPEVIDLRRQLLAPRNERHRFSAVSLTSPSWWEDLDLPNTPVVIIIEGVLMYLKPEEVSEILRVFGEKAASGSEIIFDFMCWLGVGQAQSHSPVMKHTKAEFKWGARRISELTKAHKRLHLLSKQPLFSGRNFSQKGFAWLFEKVTSVPLYGIARITAL